MIEENFLEDNLGRIFDCNMWIDSEKSGYNPAFCVYSSSLAYTKSPKAANEYLLSQYQKSPDVYFAYNLAPLMETADDIDFFVKNNAAAVRLFPKKLNYTLAGTETEPILYALEEHGLPLMVWHTETSWGEIDEICGRHPKLPVIIDGNDKKLLYHNRVYIPLLQKHQNLYLETFNFVQYLGYETLVNKYKIDRFVFGTNYPANSPLAPLYMLISANIPEEAKEKILNGNMKKLISSMKT